MLCATYLKENSGILLIERKTFRLRKENIFDIVRDMMGSVYLYIGTIRPSL